jgi:hypothetical protein
MEEFNHSRGEATKRCRLQVTHSTSSWKKALKKENQNDKIPTFFAVI